MTVYIYHSVCDNLLCSQGISWAVLLSEAGSLFQAHVTDRFQDAADVILKSLFSCWLSSEASSQLLDAAHGSLPYGPLTASHDGGFLPQGQQRSTSLQSVKMKFYIRNDVLSGVTSSTFATLTWLEAGHASCLHSRRGGCASA